MLGKIDSCTLASDYVAIRTQDGDFVIAHVPNRDLKKNDRVKGDLCNPGRVYLHCPRYETSVEVFVEHCRLSKEAAAIAMATHDAFNARKSAVA